MLLLLVPPLCPLMSHTHSDESAQAQNSSRATTTLVSPPPPPPPPPTHTHTLLTNQIPCVESVSDENLLSSVQRWELLYPHR